MESNLLLESEMNAPNIDVQKIKSGRIKSIDTIRGFTILVMIFVNDIDGVANVPSWMEHAKTMHDGMTFVDWVFPAFYLLSECQFLFQSEEE